MSFHLTVLAKDKTIETRWASDLQAALRDLADVRVTAASGGGEHGQILFVDSSFDRLESVLGGIDRAGRALFLVVREGEAAPASLLEGKVDDALVWPFRPIEALSKVRHYQHILMWEEVTQLNASFKELLERLHDDLRLAERLQKNKVPARFPDMKGFKIHSRYLAGMRSGGDHFDLADSKDGQQLSIVLSDSSSYGLSSAVLSALMRVAVKLSAEETRSARDTVRRIHEELAATLGPKDKLSLFYGVVSRRDYKLRYLNLGTSSAFYAPPKDGFTRLPSQGERITQTSGLPEAPESGLVLLPESRLALISDGFVEICGGEDGVRALLDKYREADPVDLLNEMAFKVKGAFTEADEMPAQDCTAVIFDVDARVMRVIG